jgi:hypothetical protein
MPRARIIMRNGFRSTGSHLRLTAVVSDGRGGDQRDSQDHQEAYRGFRSGCA